MKPFLPILVLVAFLSACSPEAPPPEPVVVEPKAPEVTITVPAPSVTVRPPAVKQRVVRPAKRAVRAVKRAAREVRQALTPPASPRPREEWQVCVDGGGRWFQKRCERQVP